jgi:hypothetical protein
MESACTLSDGTFSDGDRRRFVVHADEKLTAFMELEAAILRAGNVHANLN